MPREVVLGVVGGSAVGKTSLVLQWLQGHFVTDPEPTVESLYQLSYSVDERVHIPLVVVDTAGQEALGVLRDRMLCHCDAFVLVYDVCSRASFESIGRIFEHLQRLVCESSAAAPCVVAANKVDRAADRVVTTEEGASLAHSLDCSFAEVSATDGAATAAMFNSLIDLLASRQDFTTDEDHTAGAMLLADDASPVCHERLTAKSSPAPKKKKCVMF